MNAGVVDNATSITLQRCIDTKEKQPVTKQDVLEGMQRMLEENRPLNHKEAIADLIRDCKDQLTGEMTILRQSAA